MTHLYKKLPNVSMSIYPNEPINHENIREWDGFLHTLSINFLIACVNLKIIMGEEKIAEEYKEQLHKEKWKAWVAWKEVIKWSVRGDNIGKKEEKESKDMDSKYNYDYCYWDIVNRIRIAKYQEVLEYKKAYTDALEIYDTLTKQ